MTALAGDDRRNATIELAISATTTTREMVDEEMAHQSDEEDDDGDGVQGVAQPFSPRM
ncbi:MAG: hypothetical protein R2695_04750 [Acidimicrobiales bacterium]